MSKINICFTGHRPDKLVDGDNWNGRHNKQLMLTIKNQIIELLSQYDYINIMTGGAIGIDQMAFAVCYRLKEQYPDRITISLAIPFEPELQCSLWNDKQKQRHYRHIELCDKLIQVDRQLGYQYLGRGYNVRKLQMRNEYMVYNSDLVIAIWDGTCGGTYNCIRTAREENKSIVYINPNTLEIKKEIA